MGGVFIYIVCQLLERGFQALVLSYQPTSASTPISAKATQTIHDEEEEKLTYSMKLSQLAFFDCLAQSVFVK